MKKTITTCLAVFVSLCALRADPVSAPPMPGNNVKNCFIVVTKGDDGKTVELPLDRKVSVHLKSDTIWFRDAAAEKHWTDKGQSLKTWKPDLVRAEDESAAYTKDHDLKLSDDNIFTSEPVWNTGKKAPAIQEGESHDEFIFEPQKVGDTKLTFHLCKTIVDKKGDSSEKCEDKVSFNIHVVEAQPPSTPVAPAPIPVSPEPVPAPAPVAPEPTPAPVSPDPVAPTDPAAPSSIN